MSVTKRNSQRLEKIVVQFAKKIEATDVPNRLNSLYNVLDKYSKENVKLSSIKIAELEIFYLTNPQLI